MTEIDLSFSKKSYMVRAIHNDTDHCYIHEVISKIQKVQALVKLNKFQEIDLSDKLEILNGVFKHN